MSEIIPLEIKLRPHGTYKSVYGKQVWKSFSMDFVDMLGDDGRWRHVGYFCYPTQTFSGLVNWDNSLNDSMAAAIAKIKGQEVNSSPAPQDEPELTEEDDDDEFE